MSEDEQNRPGVQLFVLPQECRNCFGIEWESQSKGEAREKEDEKYLCDMCSANPEMVHRKKARVEKILMSMESGFAHRLPTILNLMYEVLLEEIEECKN